jgi:predicted small integral membrane protein
MRGGYDSKFAISLAFSIFVKLAWLCLIGGECFNMRALKKK